MIKKLIEKITWRINIMSSVYNNTDHFCERCLIHDDHFVGGGSWSPDYCPKCKKIECINWRNLSWRQQGEAMRINRDMEFEETYKRL